MVKNFTVKIFLQKLATTKIFTMNYFHVNIFNKFFQATKIDSTIWFSFALHVKICVHAYCFYMSNLLYSMHEMQHLVFALYKEHPINILIMLHKIVVHVLFDHFIRLYDCSIRVYQSSVIVLFIPACMITAVYKMCCSLSPTFWSKIHAVKSRNDHKIFNVILKSWIITHALRHEWGDPFMPYSAKL